MTVEIRFDQAVYAVDSVKKAAYRFIDRFSAEIESHDGVIVCRVTLDDATLDRQAIEAVVADFRKEVLDQDLRKAVAEETAPLRNAILAIAFAPIKPEGE